MMIDYEKRLNGAISIRKMSRHDLDRVVSVHMDSFTGFFLSSLGNAFLNNLYSFFLEEKSGIALVAVEDSEGIVGFVAGSVDPQGFYRRAIRKKLFSFAFAAFPPLIKNPLLLPRLVRAFKKPREAVDGPGDCFLMSIGVSRKHAGEGIGKKLESAFCRESLKLGARIIELTTDLNNNDSANRFYLACGYKLHDIFKTPEGRRMNRYVKNIRIA